MSSKAPTREGVRRSGTGSSSQWADAATGSFTKVLIWASPTDSSWSERVGAPKSIGVETGATGYATWGTLSDRVIVGGKFATQVTRACICPWMDHWKLKSWSCSCTTAGWAGGQVGTESLTGGGACRAAGNSSTGGRDPGGMIRSSIFGEGTHTDERIHWYRRIAWLWLLYWAVLCLETHIWVTPRDYCDMHQCPSISWDMDVMMYL